MVVSMAKRAERDRACARSLKAAAAARGVGKNVPRGS